MEYLGFLFSRLDTFLLVMSRVTGMLQMAPVFASTRIPMMVRVGLGAMIALMVTINQAWGGAGSGSLIQLVLAMAGEFILGFAIGFIVNLVMVAAQTAGQLVDMQMGFGIVNVMDPQSGQQLPLVGNLQYLVALMVLLGTNGHHMILTAIVKSYDFVPAMGMKISGSTTELIISLFVGMFVSAIKIAMPMVAALFVTDVALGIVARTVPQMNVFIVGLPLKIVVGIFMLIAVMGLYIWLIEKLLTDAFSSIDLFLRLTGA
ncbi:MAG: flagellar type III secretion system protein FliR [Firmicutes bacterium]|nr:flagellar type III secretion system protein FliR [Bacillota bacterium]